MAFTGNSTAFIEHIYTEVEEYVKTRNTTSPEALGIDPRSGYVLYYDEDGIIVKLRNDRNLQYFGTFDTITYPLRKVIAGYVFYSVAAQKVKDALFNLQNNVVEDVVTESNARNFSDES